MGKAIGPNTINGRWIWGNNESERQGNVLFCRKEFDADFEQGQIFLWVSALDAYQVYINGSLVGANTNQYEGNFIYADKYDLSTSNDIIPGPNVICIIAYSQGINSGITSGIWCQLDIDNEPRLWTDDRWRVYPGGGYQHSIVNHKEWGYDFIEKCNFDQYPNGFLELNYHQKNWIRPEKVVDIDSFPISLKFSDLNSPICLLKDASLSELGNYDQRYSVSHVTFNDVFTIPNQVYAAESFFNGRSESSVTVILCSNDPVKLFFNRELIKPFEGKKADKEGVKYYKIKTIPGWNKITVAQKSSSPYSGFFISFEKVSTNSIKLISANNLQALDGWRISGPLKSDLKSLTPNLRLRNKQDFFPIIDNLEDPSAFYGSCNFIASQEEQEDSSTVTLKKGQYVIFDLEKLRFGFPFIDILGFNGDIVDICYGNEIKSNIVVDSNTNEPYNNCDSLYLKDHPLAWIRQMPKLCRYIMVIARDVNTEIEIAQVALHELRRERDNTTLFKCSDEELNKIWAIGENTLYRTSINGLLVTPSAFGEQNLAYAMLQSLAAIYTFGDYTLANKGVVDFGLLQQEDGKIPSFISEVSEKPFYLDISLFWPVWLDQYLTLTNDKDLKLATLSHLDTLLKFFYELTRPTGGLLTDIEKDYGFSCFIDYGEIDKRGIVTALNAMYCRALFASANIFEAADMNKKSTEYSKQATAIAEKIRKLAWNEEKQLFADCICDDKQSEIFSFQTNILALSAGIASPDQFDHIWDSFFNSEPPFEKDGTSILSPYFNFFILELLFAYGKTKMAFEFIKSYWSKLSKLDSSTWQKFVDIAGNNGTPKEKQLCCGFATIPNIFLIRELAGIRTAQPGFSTIYFNPAINVVKAAQVTFPSPQGLIAINWELSDDTFKVKIDAEHQIDVAPMLPPEIMEIAEFDLGRNVNILEPKT